MKIDKRLLPFLNGVRLSLAATVIAGTFCAAITVVQAKVLSISICDVFIRNKNLSAIFSLLIFYVLLAGVRAALNLYKQHSANAIAGSIKSKIFKKLNDHINQLGPEFVKSQRSGELINIATKGIDKLEIYFSRYFPQLFLSVLIPVCILIFIFPTDIISGVILLATVPLIPFFMFLIGSAAKSKTQRQWKSLNFMSAHFLDVMQGLTTLKILGRAKVQAKEIAGISEEFRKSTMGVLKIAFLSALVLEMVAALSIAMVAVSIGIRLLYGKMGFEQALFVLILAPEVYQPLRLLGARFHAGIEGLTAAEKILDILETPPDFQDVISEEILQNFKSEIKFDNVSYAYDKRNNSVLKNVSFKLVPRTTTALVGPTGAGKTTIANLLLRFINTKSGDIFIDETNLREIEAESWYDKISWVPQKPYLFFGTIAENIKFGKPDANLNKIISAAKMANLDNFVESLPEKYETMIGERGTRLSGGQAQRLALARAFLKDSPLLIMDEPTSNLDPENEEKLCRSIAKLKSGKTTLLIAHRLSTVKEADNILVLKAGEIVEEGNHNTLMKNRKDYFKMATCDLK